MASKYLKLELNPDSVQVDTVSGSCKITSSLIKGNIDIDDTKPEPKIGVEIIYSKQFNLQSIYPWFYKQSLKDDINKANDLKPLIRVKPNGYENAVSLESLKNYKDSSSKKYYLRYTNNISSLIRGASDQKEYSWRAPNLTEPTPPQPPNFKKDTEGNIYAECLFQFYSCSLDANGAETDIDYDIVGFYYQDGNEDSKINYSINKDSVFIFEAKIPHSLAYNKNNIEKYIKPNGYHAFYRESISWPPGIGDSVVLIDQVSGNELNGVITKLPKSKVYNQDRPNDDKYGINTGDPQLVYTTLVGDIYRVESCEMRKYLSRNSKVQPEKTAVTIHTLNHILEKEEDGQIITLETPERKQVIHLEVDDVIEVKVYFPMTEEEKQYGTVFYEQGDDGNINELTDKRPFWKIAQIKTINNSTETEPKFTVQFLSADNVAA